MVIRTTIMKKTFTSIFLLVAIIAGTAPHIVPEDHKEHTEETSTVRNVKIFYKSEQDKSIDDDNNII